MPKIAIIGGGVIGLTTAWFLHRGGAKVTVFEATDRIAMGASGLNACQLGFSSILPPVSFEAALNNIPSVILGRDDRPFYAQRPLYFNMLRFMAAGFLSSPLPLFSRRFKRLLSMAEQSQSVLSDIYDDLPDLDFHHERGCGKYALFNSGSDAKPLIKKLTSVGLKKDIDYSILSAADLTEEKPFLTYRSAEAVAVKYHNTDYGRSDLFCERLEADLVAKGDFALETASYASDIKISDGAISAVNVNGNWRDEFDAYVFAAGAHTAEYFEALGIQAPFYPLKGYSLDIPLDRLSDDMKDALKNTGTLLVSDTPNTISLAHHDGHFRISGLMDMDDWTVGATPVRETYFRQSINQAYPDIDIDGLDCRVGLRPATASGLPLIGKTRLKNAYINTGQGAWGWTLSFGSGRELAEIILKDFS